MKGKTLQETAYQEIKNKIIRGDFLESGFTSQNQLASELGISRTPIMAALQRLQNEGFVKIISNHGIQILGLNVREIEEMYELRLALETFIIPKIVKSITAEQIEILEEFIQEQKKCVENNDLIEFLKLDSAFHLQLTEVYGNSLFIQTLSNIRERLFSNPYYFRRKDYQISRYIKEHEQIIEAIKSKDINQVIKELESHING
ncbi:GntR family transcriptional regulator [Gottfriedia sp. NPDC057991]|uniref:GntR family transcriptional regulator n=1 Tax=Gottfriedia sp. NPDC057991 TaxID=3346298 RepID=UPI0036DF7677